MKKYILPAFIVSFVVATTVFFYPQIFLIGDAKWTFQNNMAQIDMSIQNATSGDTIKVMGGGNSKTTKSQWQLEKNLNQFTLNFPVTYSLQTYHFTIKPQTKNLSKKIDLNFQFKAKDFYVNNHIKPAWVRFKNIQINDKNISKNAKVNYQEPFEYSLENISPDEEIQLDFEIKKPLSINHFSFFICFFILIIVTSFIYSISQGTITHPKDKNPLIYFIEKYFFQKDISQIILDGYHRIHPIYRNSFWIIFGILCFAFGFHTICFMWGNHDWEFLVHPYIYIYSFMGIGRYALGLTKVLLFNGVYLPIIYDMITFLVLALNAILLCNYWNLEKKVTYYVLCGLILTAQPFTLSILYYVHMIPETFIGVTLALIALILSKNIFLDSISLFRKLLFSFISIIFINLALAMYPVLINTIAVAFVGRLLIQSFDWNGTWQNFKSCFMKYIVSILNIFLGIALYKYITTFIYPMSAHEYNTQIIQVNDIPERFFNLIGQSFYQFIEYSYPFISQNILLLFFSLLLSLFIYICYTGNIKQKFLRLFLLFASLFATQTAMLIADTHIISGRIELFGLVVFEVLTIVLIFQQMKPLHNFLIILITGTTIVSIVNDLDCLRVWKLGFDAEKMLWNRVLMRLEMQKDFNPFHKYKIVQIGKPISLRSNFYLKPAEDFNTAEDILTFSYDANWDLFHAHEFYYSRPFREERIFTMRPSEREYQEQLKRLYDAGILNKAKAWPDENGLIVWDDIILYVTDEKVLEDYKKQLKKTM